MARLQCARGKVITVLSSACAGRDFHSSMQPFLTIREEKESSS